MCVSLRVFFQWELIKTVKILSHSTICIFAAQELLDLQCVGEHADLEKHLDLEKHNKNTWWCRN